MRKLLLCLAVTLSACGGGGSSSSSAAEPDASVSSSTYVIEAYGDSTIVRENVVEQAAALVLRETGNSSIALVNKGVRGTNGLQLLTGTDGVHRPWADEVTDSPAKIITINHGINDTYPSLQDYRDTIQRLVLIAKGQGKVVMLETPNPVVQGPGIRQDYDVAALADRVAAMKSVAALFSVPVCDQDSAMRAAGLATLAAMPDGVHPSPATAAWKADFYAKCLLTLLR